MCKSDPVPSAISTKLEVLLLWAAFEKISFNNQSKYPWKGLWMEDFEPSVEQVCFIALCFSFGLYCCTVACCVCMCVFLSGWSSTVAMSQSLQEGRSQPCAMWELQGAGLTRCPGSWQLCPAACEWRWHKEGPAESTVCSLCLPFSSAQDLCYKRKPRKKALWHQVDEALCLFSISLLPICLFSRPEKKKSIHFSLGLLSMCFSCSC